MRTHDTKIRVRYYETDQMGTVSNSRALEWFEVGRSEWLRATGKTYAQMETEGVMLPLTESYVKYISQTVYDEELVISTSAKMLGKARIQFDLEVTHLDTGKTVLAGYTVHAFTDTTGRPTRPPKWIADIVNS